MRKTRNQIQSTKYIVPFLISMILWFDPRHSYIKDRSNYLQLSGISVKKVAKKYYHNILMIMFTEFIQIYSFKDFIYPSIKVLHSLMLKMLRNNFSSCHESGEWLINTKMYYYVNYITTIQFIISLMRFYLQGEFYYMNVRYNIVLYFICSNYSIDFISRWINLVDILQTTFDTSNMARDDYPLSSPPPSS